MNLKPLLVLAAFALSWPASAQDEPQDTIISVDVQVVNVLATVRDKDGVLVSNLTQGDFELYEDGVLQDIQYFTRQADLPLTIGLLVDTSVSQQNLIYEERTAGYRFFDKVLRIERDLAFLMSFDIDVELLQDLTAAKPLLQDGLERLEVQGSSGGVVTPGTVPQNGKPVGTAMFDGIYLAATEMLKGQAGRKALVLVTDGYDYGSKVDIEEAIEASQRSDVIVFSVRYYDTRFYQGAAVIGGGRSDLRRLSRSTGGDTYEVKRRQTLDQIFDDINNVVRNQYSIGYSPKRDLSETGFRKLELKLKNKRLEAQTREGYYPSEL
ncbi:MAG: VWA domain-containing protein [Acidobacteria bacterium]|nr:VWA domain-containing protein [Acidobacteriota bacterium]MDA1234427.1 VWA domain-containing protein [Acidobacteriota bacterium]